jgi:sulfoxide reductase heme-binding subunit YedZ
MFGFALLTSSVFKFFPNLSDYWRVRRYMGVTGFTFIVGHVMSVYHYLFSWDVKAVYYTFNPLENPIIFGSIAFPIFMVMALTSTDWAVAKLGDRNWKRIHRLVYIAYLSAIFHFITINPMLLKNPPGYLLLTVTALTLLGQLYWFFRTVSAKKFRSWGTLYGFFLIAATLALGYLAYQKFFPASGETPPAGDGAPSPADDISTEDFL